MNWWRREESATSWPPPWWIQWPPSWAGPSQSGSSSGRAWSSRAAEPSPLCRPVFAGHIGRARHLGARDGLRAHRPGARDRGLRSRGPLRIGRVLAGGRPGPIHRGGRAVCGPGIGRSERRRRRRSGEGRHAALKADQIEHSYPHCWRCASPIIFRATEQWFASVEGFPHGGAGGHPQGPSGFPSGARSASATWWPTGPIGASPANGCGAFRCPSSAASIAASTWSTRPA